ncbi:hemerythrin domain-containing protein [Propionibacteriaceae bacterium Y2011]|uniref:hemerythrin domain-containing protein n=1 Tax=Microlunatus sp. Y2014 TaxID=3418488 RepID=UPI003D55063E
MPLPDVVDLITADHREVERLFDELKAKPDQRALLLPEVSSLLIAHSRAEEADVYPVAREEAGESDQVAHSQEEHEQAEALLAALGKLDPSAAEFDTKLEELISAVTHHVEEEEAEVLPGIRERLNEHRRAELAKAFVRTRTEHLGDRPGGATREELLQRAQNLGLSGVASMTKEELSRAIEQD